MTRRLLPLFAACLLTFSQLVFAQAEPDALSAEDQQLEEEHQRSKEENGESHASGQRPELGPVSLGNPTEAHTTIRVGISYSFTSTGAFSEFQTRHFPVVAVSHTAGDLHVIDVATGKQIIAIEPGTLISATRSSAGYSLTVGGLDLGVFEGPIFLRPTDAANLFRIENILRTFSGNKVPSYRGTIELSHGGGTPANTLNAVNIVEVEDYVPGVVANESIASFHPEALKAQAVAARGYAIANIGRFRADFPYDIVDSSTSQVYRGVISEDPRAVLAAASTRGLVVSYQGEIAEALYSSSFGGHSDHSETAFNFRPYLRAVYDGDGTPPTSDDETFWKTNPRPDVYDDCVRTRPPANSFSRWTFRLTGATIKSRLPGRFVLISGSTTGTVLNVEVVSRTASGRIANARITLTSPAGVVEVRGWDNLRRVLGATPPSGTTPVALRACGSTVTAPPTTIVANMVMTNPSAIQVNRNAGGAFVDVTIWGGGWGHNVGMSQYGSHGRGKAGQTFVQILKGYYTGVDIGSYPIDIGRTRGGGPPLLRQEFYAQNASGTLFVRNATMRKLRIHINELYDIALNEDELADGEATVDISAYLTPGINVVQYNTVGQGQATVNVVTD